MPAIGIVKPTGDLYIDGLLNGTKWGVSSLTFSFPTDASFYGSPYASGESTNGFEAFTAQQQAAVRSILASYSSVINFTFTEITETSTQHADIRYAESDLPSTAWAYYPSTSATGGDAWFNNSKNWYDNPILGNYAWFTIMHETGHAMGLKHPHTVFSAYYPAMPLDHDSLEYTVMSYRSYVGAGTSGVTNEAFGYPQSLMMYDIAALQEMYGANFGTNGGNTVYSWNPVTGQEYINGVAQIAPGANRIFLTIWDGGGEDTYDFSNYTTNLNVNLAPGGWTTVSTAQLANLGAGHYATGNIANALLYHGNTASLIENAIGGVGNDTIAGNDANNKITGGSGNDTLDGGAGSDTAIYSGAYSSYQIVHNTNGSWTIVDLRGGSPDGTDTLTNFEFLKFSDTIVALNDVPDTPPALQVPTIASFSADSGTLGDRITNDNTLTFTGTGTAGSTIKLYDGSALLGTAIVAANGAWTFTTAVLSEGTHSFSATASNSAGSTTAASTTLAVTVDTIAPNTPVIAGFTPDTATAGDGITKAATITLSGTAEAGSIVHVYDGSTLLGTATAAANGTWSFSTYDPAASAPAFGCSCAACAAAQAEEKNVGFDSAGSGSVLSDGVHSFTVKAVDVAGNSSSFSVALNVTVDTTTATPTIAAFSSDSGMQGDGITNDNTLMLTGTAEAGSTVQIYDGATLIGTTTANGSGGWSFTTLPLADGGHSFSAKAVDVAGNTSAASAGKNVVIDTVAPAAPVITGVSNDSGLQGDGITNDNTLALTGTAEAGSTVQVFEGANLIGTTTANGSGGWSFTTSQLADGAHSFTVKALDVAGNTSAASASKSVVIDTVAPTAPTITAFSPDSGVTGDGLTNSNQITVSGTAEAGSTVQVFDGVTLVGTAMANASGLWNFATPALTDGTHSLTARAIDAAGNLGTASVVFNVTVDTGMSQTTTISAFTDDSGTIGDGVTNDNTLVLLGTAKPNSTVHIYDGTELIGTANANGSGAWSFATAALSDGTHSFSASATDAAGNTGARSATYAISVDTVAPSTPAISTFSNDSGMSGDGVTNDNTLLLSGSAEAGSTVHIYDGLQLLGTATVSQGGMWTFATAALTNGAHNFAAKAVDGAGNISALSATKSIVVDTVAPVAPVIAKVTSDSGTVAGTTNNNTLTIEGTAEVGGTLEVYDGGLLVGSVVVDADGTWSIATADLADGVHSFTAKSIDAAGNISTSVAKSVTVDTVAPNQPLIASVTPDSGAVGDGLTNASVLTLVGTAEGGSVVRIYDGAAIIGTVTANSVGSWTFATSPLNDGVHNFSVKAVDAAGNQSGGSLVRTVTIDSQAPETPTITAFSPDSGIVGDGVTDASQIVLSGTAEAHCKLDIYDGANLIGTVSVAADGTWNFATPTLGDGAHSFSARATDRAGNVSAAGTMSVVIDTQGNNKTIVSIVGEDGISLIGTAENDTLIGSSGDDILMGRGGNDVLDGGVGNDQLDGGDGNDTLLGNWGNDVLQGGAGNDYLNGGDGADIMRGGSGNDLYIVDNIGDLVEETLADGSDAGGDDMVMSSVSFTLGKYVEKLILQGNGDIDGIGNASANLIQGTSGANLLDGGDGNDTLMGGAGNDKLYGGAGADYLNGGDGNDQLYGGADSDTLDGGVGDDFIDGGDGNDTLLGNWGNDLLLGGAGNDYLNGGAGADIMRGGSGNDLYIVDNIGDLVEETLADGSDAGGDDMVMSSVSFTLGKYVEKLILQGNGDIDGIGNASNNLIQGTSGANLLDGGDGNDTLLGGAGNDKLFGGAGSDYLNGGADNDELYGGADNDTLDGGIGDDLLDGGDGNDTLLGNWGNDVLQGGAGNDYLNGGDGADIMRGGSGNDLYIVDNIGDIVEETLADGSDAGGDDMVMSSVSITLGKYIEKLILQGNGDIDGIGNASNNLIQGTSGANLLDGGDGNDTLMAGAGNDKLYGGAGNDYLNGGDGNDTLNGGSGNDTLVGAAGSDKFVFESNFGKDLIQDFQTSGPDMDVLNFTQDVFADFAAVLAHASQVGTSVIIAADGNNIVTLLNVSVADLNSSNVHVV